MAELKIMDMDTKQDFSDWECVCGYVNEGIDGDCKRCSRDRASGVAELNAHREAELVAAQKAKLEEQQRLEAQAAERERVLALRREQLVDLEFHGQPREFLGTFILMSLLSAVTLGIYSFWATARTIQWTVANSSLEGRALKFTGTGVDVLVAWLLNGLLVSISFGIYTPWAIANIMQWFIERVEYAD